VGNLKNWVYSIARNTIIDYYRKKKEFTSEIGEAVYIHEEDSKDVAIELGQCISSFISELPEDYKTIMILSEIEGISQKDISEQLGMNYVTVRSKIQRGRKKLKVLISDCCTVFQGGKGSILDYVEKGNCNKGDDCLKPGLNQTNNKAGCDNC